MKAILMVTGAAATLGLAGCGEGSNASNASGGSSAPLEQIKAPNGDWSSIVSATPEGGMRMGNPTAPVKLVEYGSMTCGHCAEFSEEASEPLVERYVKTGQVSWEFRPFLLFGPDAGLSTLLACQGPGPYFQLMEQLYAQQGALLEKVQSLPAEAQQQLQGLPPQQAAIALIKVAGLDQFFRQRGLPQARIDACLADPQAMQRLIATQQRATNQEGVTGTPTFFINGEKLQRVSNWAALEPALREAL